MLKEPPINRSLSDLDPEFRSRLEMVLAALESEGTPFRLVEGLRTVARQRWLYGQGRPQRGGPYGRPGLIVTQRDGIVRLSNHQSGRAADCYPLSSGKVVIEAPDLLWKRYAETAEAHGLVAGYRWTKPHDPPHVELA